MEGTQQPASEFSRIITADPSRAGSIHIQVTASKEECGALSQRFGVETIENLEADCRLLLSTTANRIRLEAKYFADVTQLCVITLEPLTVHIAGIFAREYIAAAAIEEVGEVLIDPNADDPPEVIPEGGIDAGEAVAEELGLEIDPFPRAPGAEFSDHTNGDSADHPFAELKSLKIKNE